MRVLSLLKRLLVALLTRTTGTWIGTPEQQYRHR